MNKEELTKIIDQIEDKSKSKDTTFGIFVYGGGEDESYIKANKQGLELFAVNLLKAACEIDEKSGLSENLKIPLDYEADWIDKESSIFLQYVELSEKKPEYVKNENDKDNWKERALRFGCLAGLFIIVSVFILGMVSFFKILF
ncbi:MAG: hypothetical protein GXX85_01685 [Ignavibacteria bacterium]|nr:hypothetical protein [Ignavibacteria bacterium]